MGENFLDNAIFADLNERNITANTLSVIHCKKLDYDYMNNHTNDFTWPAGTFHMEC